MEIGVEHADGRWRLVAFVEQALGNHHGLLAHVAFNHPALAVDAVEHFGQFVGAGHIVGQQALDAQRHVGQAACGIDARAQRKAEVESGGGAGVAARCYKKAS